MADPLTAYDVAKDFQPTFAAVIALTAAAIAYRGAVARIAYEKAIAEMVRQGTQLSLCTRLKLRTLPLAAFAKYVSEWLEKEGPKLPTQAVVDQMTAWPATPDEFEEAWQHLDLIPVAAIEILDALRDQQRRMAYVCARPPEENERERRYKPWYRTIISVAKEIAVRADALDKVLGDEIAAIRKI